MKLPDKSLSNRILLTIAAVVIIVWFYPHRNVSQFVYEQGRPWNYAQLIAPFDIPIHPDSVTIKAVRDTLDLRFVPIYSDSKRTVDSIIAELPQSSAGYASRLASYIRSAYSQGVISSADMEKVRDGKLAKVRMLEKNILSEETTAGFTTPRDLYRRIDSLITDPDFHSYFVSANLPDVLRPNIIYNETESKRH